MKLFIVQKKVIRVICGTKRRESTETAFTDLEIMTFSEISMFLIGRFMFRLHRGRSQICSLISLFEMRRFMIIPHANANISMFPVNEAPDMFSDFFMRNAEIHDYSTRQRQHSHVPSERSNLGNFGIRYRRAIVWNFILKLDINPNTTEAVFIKTIKKNITNGSLCFWYLISHRIMVPAEISTHYGWNFAINIFNFLCLMAISVYWLKSERS